MAKGSLNLKVSQSDFERRIAIIQMRMDALNDVVSRYRDAKSNLDQFIEGNDDNYESMCQRIDANVDAAGRSYAALKEMKEEMENTVTQLTQMSGKVKETITSAVDATKSTVEAAIRINSIL